jgi:uncharacterized protein (UPF0212 family)
MNAKVNAKIEALTTALDEVTNCASIEAAAGAALTAALVVAIGAGATADELIAAATEGYAQQGAALPKVFPSNVKRLMKAPKAALAIVASSGKALNNKLLDFAKVPTVRKVGAKAAPKAAAAAAAAPKAELTGLAAVLLQARAIRAALPKETADQALLESCDNFIACLAMNLPKAAK